MFIARMPKVAMALVAATVLTTGAAVAWTATQTGGDSAQNGSTLRVDGGGGKSLNLIPAGGIVDGAQAVGGNGGALGSPSAGASLSGSGATVGVGAGTATGGTPSSAASPASGTGSVSGPATGSSSPGGALPNIGSGGGTSSPTPGSLATGTGSGSGGSGVTVPTVPPVPSGVSVYREGSYTLFVPGTAAVSKKLCLSGEVNRCRTINVPALHGVRIDLSYSANASADAPTFAVFPCQGGLGVTLSGITPGTSVVAQAEGVDLAATLSSQEASQSASLCDA